MLQKIRDGRQGIFGWLVIGAIVVVMAFFGMGSFLSQSVDPVMATVNGTELTQSDYDRRYQQYLSLERRRLGERFNAQLFDSPMFRRQFLDNLIEESLLVDTLRDSGLSVANSELRETIRSAPGFQQNGQFDPELYQIYLNGVGKTSSQFEDELRRDMLLQQLPRLIGGSSIATASEAGSLAQLQAQTRSFDYLTVTTTEFLDDIEIADEQVAAFYNDNPLSFMEPERVRVEYLELNADDFMATAEIDEADLRQRYEARKLMLGQAERRLTSHILLGLDEDADENEATAVEEKATELARRARAGEDFAALAREFSEDPGSADLGGDLDWVEPGMMVEAFDQALFALEPGTFSDPVRTEYGYHVIQLREVRSEAADSFEDLRAELEQEARREIAEQRFDELESQLSQLAFEQSNSLQALADVLERPVQTSELFSAVSGGGVAATPAVRTAAFSDEVLLERRNSDPISIGERHVAYLRVAEFLDAQPKSLDSVRDQISEQLRDEQAQAKVAQVIEELLDNAQAGESLSALAENGEHQFKSVTGAARFGGDVPGTVLRAVFALPHDRQSETGGLHVVDAGRGDQALVQLKAVESPPQTTPDEAVLARVSRSQASAEIAALIASLRDSADIVVKEGQFQSQ